MNEKLCCDFVWSRGQPLVSCKNPAKYKYQITRFRVEYLCGVHARRFRESPNLAPLPPDDTIEADNEYVTELAEERIGGTQIGFGL